MMKIISKVSNFELILVFMVPAIPGVLAVLVGLVYEAWVQSHLLDLHGAEALRAYLSLSGSANASVFRAIWLGMTNSLPWKSSVIQAYGFALLFFVTPVCVLCSLFARCYVRVAAKRFKGSYA